MVGRVVVGSGALEWSLVERAVGPVGAVVSDVVDHELAPRHLRSSGCGFNAGVGEDLPDG